MNDSRLASRYAKALFQLVKEKGLVDQVTGDLSKVSSLLQTSAEFKWFLESPVLMSSQKADIISKILKDAVQPVTLDFLQLMIHHRREANLASTCRMYMELYKADRGILEARIASATAVDQQFLDGLKKKLEDSSRRKVELITETNENLIGGFILTLEDQQLDASVQSKLNRIRQELRESKK